MFKPGGPFALLLSHISMWQTISSTRHCSRYVAIHPRSIPDTINPQNNALSVLHDTKPSRPPAPPRTLRVQVSRRRTFIGLNLKTIKNSTLLPQHSHPHIDAGANFVRKEPKPPIILERQNILEHEHSVIHAYRERIWDVDQKHDARRVDEERQRDLPGVAHGLLGHRRVPLIHAHALEDPLHVRSRTHR